MKTQQKNTRKKLFSLTSVVLATIVIAIYSCKKEATTQPENENTFGLSIAKTPSSNSGQRSLGSSTCLAFANIVGYESAVTQPTKQIQTSLSSLINSFSTFTSYTTTHPNDTLFGDPAITDILNQDAVIQIAGYYFKIDPVLEKVFVLPITDAAYYNDLISAYPQSGKVTMFSTNDDVLSLIETGAVLNTQLATIDLDSIATNTITQRGWLKRLYVKVVTAINSSPFANRLGACEDPMAKHDYQRQHTSSEQPYRTINDKTGRVLYAEVRYRTWGIYFWAPFTGWVRYDTGAHVQDTLNLHISFYYKVRCKEAVGPKQTIVHGDKGSDATYTAYRGARQLAYYEFSAFSTESVVDPTPIGGAYPYITHRTNLASISH